MSDEPPAEYSESLTELLARSRAAREKSRATADQSTVEDAALGEALQRSYGNADRRQRVVAVDVERRKSRE